MPIYQSRPVEQVLYGPGSVERWQRIAVLNGARATLVTTPSVARSPLFARLTTLFAPVLTATFKESRQHAPISAVRHLAEHLLESRANVVISVGGGSVIDTVKAAIDAHAHPSGMYLPHVALPTTLSAAEFAPGYGMTDDDTRRKHRGSDPALIPRAVILDAELTMHTPRWLWLGSGLRALDHAVETVYAPDHNPVADALALEAIRILFRALPASVPAEERVEERQQCQYAAWLSFQHAGSVSLGTSHRLGRVIGPMYSVPHGFTSSILLPHVMDAVLKQSRERQALIARAALDGLGEPGAAGAERAAELVRALVRRLELPVRLRDVGVPRGDLGSLAGDSQDDRHILEAAW
jgi:alcohol dehydrogenase